MKLKKVSEIFDVQSGNGFELNALTRQADGINFVARGMKDNGVVAKVSKVIGVTPFAAGSISVAASGSVMESFLQPKPFYTAYHIFILTPKNEMSDAVKLFYCMCLRRNRFKYSYGRQANETLSDLLIPDLCEVPYYAINTSLHDIEKKLLENVKIDGLSDTNPDALESPQLVRLDSIFDLTNGISSDKVLKNNQKLSDNWVPFIRPSYRQSTSIDAYVNKTLAPADKVFPQGSLYVSTNGQGSHTYSYVSASEFVPNSDVCVLTPKGGRKMCLREKLYYAMIITNNRFKFSYGRKPKGEKLASLMVPETMPKAYNDICITNIASN